MTKIIVDSKIATKEELDKSIAANTYDYVSATYLLLAEQVNLHFLIKFMRVTSILSLLAPSQVN